MASARTGTRAQRGAVEDWHVLQRALPLTPSAARLARMTARVACRAWRAPRSEEAAALVASELVTVALRHAVAGPISLRVRMTPRRLRLEVHDPSGGLPPDVGADQLDARSIAVVAATAARWGVEPHLPGAVLWAELAVDLSPSARRRR